MQRPTEHASAPPMVSIITPAFNAARFVRQTLDSARAQTFTDFELLVVDDGSTDETAAIVHAFTQQDARIRLIRRSHQGVCAARNTAIAEARAPLLALLDSDDVWFPEFLAEQVDIMRRRPDVAVLSANAINLGGDLDGQTLFTWSRRSRLRKVSLPMLVRAEDSMSILALLRREVVEAIGGFDVTLPRSEDYDLWLRAARAGFRIAVNSKPLGLYRRRPDSNSADEVRMLHAVTTALFKLRERCSDPQIQLLIDRQVARLARRALLVTARTALLRGDRAQLQTQFSALAETTGLMRYRVAGWLTNRAPGAVWWAYQCKQRLQQLRKHGAAIGYRGATTGWQIGATPNEPEQLNL